MRKLVLALFVLSLAAMACSKKDESQKAAGSAEKGDTTMQQQAKRPLSNQEIQERIAKVKSLPAEPVAADEVGIIETSLGRIVIEFFPDVAPNHCANFKKLANAGFWDDITFHRVIPGFMIQTGDVLTADDDPGNDGTGSPGYTVNAEFSDITHARGIVSMARKSTGPNTAGCQFFICVADAPFLDGEYSVFGRVIEGMEVADKIAAMPRDKRDRPLQDVIVYSIRVVKKEAA